MPKALLQIKSFNLGIISAVDESDVPEGGLVNATNIMCDVPGKIRPMGQDKIHDDLDSEIAATITPGYGLFAYRSDFKVSSNEPIESKILAFQNGNGIGFYDTDPTVNLLTLGALSLPTMPAFYYTSIDGALRVSDSNFDNIAYAEEEIGSLSDTKLDTDSHIFVKYLKFINKTWFHEGVAYHAGSGYPSSEGFNTHDFASANSGSGLDAFIYPPTTLGTTAALADSSTTNSHNLVHSHASDANNAFDATARGRINFSTYGGANVAFYVTKTAGNGTWLADDGLQFGATLVYEGNQESPITNFGTTYDSGTPITDDGYSLDIQVFASTKGWDPRVTGVNIYLVGNNGGEFQDPLRLLDFHFGSSKFDPPKIKTSDGDVFDASNITIDGTNDVAYNDTAEIIKIKNEPVITFELINGYRHDTESIAANYKTSVITNRRCYIGGVRRLKFDVNTIADSGWQGGQNEGYKQPEITCATVTPELDTIYMSTLSVPPHEESFDIFPKENYISIGANDGEHIVALLEYADRLLQFKTNKLYIIILSDGAEDLEAEYDYMGIQYPYQVIRTEKGIAWTNANGCYLYDGEKITNLIDGKLHKTKERLNNDDVEGWFDFSNNTGMIGYIPISEQLIIFENPEASSIGSAGNAFIYDFRTGSWTRALDVLSPLPKSNIVTNYDNTCLYATMQAATNEEISIIANEEDIGEDAYWELDACNATGLVSDADGCVLKIGSVAITNTFFYPVDGGSSTFMAALVTEIISKTGNDFLFSNPEPGVIRITREAEKIDGTYSGALSWDTSGSLGPPTTSAQSFTPHIFPVKMQNNVQQMVDDQVFNYSHHISWSGVSQVEINNELYWITSKYIDYIYNISSSGLPLPSNYISDTIRDETRIVITATDGSTYWDNDNDATMNFDLYSATGQEFGNTAIDTSTENGNSVLMRYGNVPKIDGTGSIGPTQNADGDNVLSHQSNFFASIQIPTAIFSSVNSIVDEYGPTIYNIALPGNWSDSFTPGIVYTIAGVESGANSEKVNALNISLLLNDVQYIDLTEDLGGANALGVTELRFRYSEQSAATKSTNWPYLIHWTTFNTITISSASAATIGSSNIGLVGEVSFFNITPKRHGTYFVAGSNIYSSYNIGIDGQNSKSYNIAVEAPEASNGYIISSSIKAQLDAIYDAETSKPFGQPSIMSIDRANILYNSDNTTPTELSVSISATDTTSFSFTDTTNIVQGDYLQLLGSATNISGAEIVRVTDISAANRTTVTCVRAQLGTSALSSITAEAATSIFKLNVIQQINSVNFKIYGGDYRDIFTPNTLFKIWTGLDTAGANQWPDPTAWSLIAFSTYTNPGATGNYTNIIIDATESNSEANVGNATLDGANSSYYTSYEAGHSIIETNVLKLPGRLTSNSGLPVLNLSGLVTRSLEIREFINTERWANTSNQNIIFETKSYDFGDSGQEVKLYKIAINAMHKLGSLQCLYSVDGEEYRRLFDKNGETIIIFNRHFTNIDLYFNSPDDLKVPITARRLKIKITGHVEGFHLNDLSVVYRPKGGVR